MNRPDACAGEHGVGRFGYHRQINRNAVAFFHAVFLEHIRNAADALMKLPVCDLLIHIGVIAFPQDGNLVAAFFEMAVHTVRADVKRSVLEPLDRKVVRVERGVLDFGEGFDPIKPGRLLTPESVRIADAALIHGAIFFRVDVGRGTPLRRNRIGLSRH